MTGFLNQANFPWLWLLFQYAVGGNIDKQRLVLQSYHGERDVLEIGCSMGNLADIFRRVDGVAYLGLDVDAAAIALARRRFRKHPNFDFICGSPAQLTRHFDLVYFAGVLHHLPDAEALSLLRIATGALHPDSRVVVIEPRPAIRGDVPLVRWYANSLEQGHHLRSVEALRALVSAVPGFHIRSAHVAPIGATPFSWPLCAHFIVMEIVLHSDD